MKKIILLFLCIPISIFSGNENLAIGGRATGMGNTGICFSDVWAVRYNQACLADISKISAGLSYESRFLTKSLGIKSFAFVFPTKSGTFGLSYTGFGDKLYQESKIGLGYGMKISKKFNVGINVNYHQIRLGNNYGTKQNLTFEIGLLGKINDNLKIGFHLFNPLTAKINDYQDETIPVLISFGINYKFSDKISTNIELEKDIDFKPNFKVGIEYKPKKNLYIRTGIETNPMAPSLGFGIIYKQFNIDISSSFHQVLGITPALGVVYKMK